MSLSDKNSDNYTFPNGNNDDFASTTEIVDAKRVTPDPNECYAHGIKRMVVALNSKKPGLLPKNWKKYMNDVVSKLASLTKYGDPGSFAG